MNLCGDQQGSRKKDDIAQPFGAFVHAANRPVIGSVRERLTPTLLAFLLGSPGTVLAEGLAADCVRSYAEGAHANYYQFFSATTVSIPRDTMVGDVFGPWITASAPTAWRCIPWTPPPGVEYWVSVQGYPPYPLISTAVEHDGHVYSSYATNNPELGYIARWRYMVDGTVSEWTPLTVPTGAQQTPPHSFNKYWDYAQPYFLGVETQIKFVKRVNYIASGFKNNTFDPIYVRHYQTIPNGNHSVGSGTYRISQFLADRATFLAGGTCTTPDVNVDLDPVPIASFSGIGSTAARKAFELSFRNCPSGLNSIGYMFGTTTSVVDASNAVVAPDSGTTTRGIGVQFLNESDDPLQFGHLYPLSDYDAEIGGTYTVPLKAGLFQTDLVIGGGSIKGAITFTLDYK